MSVSESGPALFGAVRDLRTDSTWPAARKTFLAGLPPFPRCHRCGGVITGRVDVDHDPPYALTGSHADLFPCHPECNHSAGGTFGNERKRLRAAAAAEADDPDGVRPRPTQVGAEAPSSPGPEHPQWQVPWLVPLLDVPDDATWPRYMTPPHPDAVGSLGAELEAWVAAHGRSLRWWQRLAARRLLEVDAAERLVWAEYLATVARQSGKSVLLREALGWRLMTGSARYGEVQTLLHIAQTEAIAAEVQRPFRAWAKGQADLGVREANGAVGVETPDGSRWLVKASKSVYGMSASVAAVDEAWAIPAAVVDDGLVPTMLEREQAQLGLWSTANSQATGLMLDRRAACLEQLAEQVEPEGVLLLEWSAGAGRDDDDEDGWREASPHWSDRRRALIARQLRQARSGASIDPDEPDPMVAFRSQYLNRWPIAKVRTRRGQPLFADGVWDRAAAEPEVAESPESPLVVAVEDTSGDRASAVAAVELTDGRIAVWGELFDSRADAISWALALADKYDDGARARVLVGASMVGDRALAGALVKVEPVGSKEFRTGLPLLRSLLGGGRVMHDSGPDLTRQVGAVRVLEGPAGLGLVGGVRSDMLRCLVWVVQASTVRPWVVPQVY